MAAAAAAAARGSNRSSSSSAMFGGAEDHGGAANSLPPSPSSLFALGPSPSLAKDGFADALGGGVGEAMDGAMDGEATAAKVLAPWEQTESAEEVATEHLSRLSSSASSSSKALLEDDERAAKLRHASLQNISSVPF